MLTHQQYNTGKYANSENTNDENYSKDIRCTAIDCL